MKALHVMLYFYITLSFFITYYHKDLPKRKLRSATKARKSNKSNTLHIYGLFV